MFFLAVLLSVRHMGFRLREMASNDVTLTCWSIDFQLRSHLSFTVNLLILVSPHAKSRCDPTLPMLQP